VVLEAGEEALEAQTVRPWVAEVEAVAEVAVEFCFALPES